MSIEPIPLPVPLPLDLADVFERQADTTPDALALSAQDASLTFTELDRAANRLAHHLLELGVPAGAPVGFCVERGLHMTVGVLAILKAGAACMPLDPAYPAERLRAMLDDAKPEAVLASAGSSDRLPTVPPVRVVNVDADRTALAVQPDHRPERVAAPERPAYLIYTSGSTGEPRGVLLPHRALLNHCAAAVDRYGLSAADRVLQFCSPSFDVSIEELFPTWAAGARLVLRPPGLPILGRVWLDWLGESGITVLNLPTAYWHAWVRDLQATGGRPPSCLRVVIVGGEQATAEAYRGWRRSGADGIRWFNAYGPTEASVMATIYEAPRGATDAETDPPIGGPLPGVTVHLLDQVGRPVPPGHSGEVYIGGVGLALGYLNRPGLTAERFVPDPFSCRPGARMYRTGDLGRLRADGELEFAGRLDRQVKVSGGYRVEPGEVEAALRAQPGVHDAAVLVAADQQGDRRLVAYVVAVPGATVSMVDLRSRVLSRLPAFLVPARFVQLAELPLTTNGKVDRAALATRYGRPDDEAAPPRSGTEQAVAAIWSEILGIDEAGRPDDLYQLGGNSLLATQLAARLQGHFGTPVPLAMLLATPTIAGLVRHLDAAGARVPPGAPSMIGRHRRSGEPIPLSLPQEQMWSLQSTTGAVANQNVTACHHFFEQVDTAALQVALRHVVERQESLRTRFLVSEGHPCQEILDEVPVDLSSVDLSAEESALWAHVAQQDAVRFELSGAPLFRVRVYRLDAVRSVLAVTFDHLVCDGPSAYIFLSELVTTYRALTHGTPAKLPPLAVRYSDFACWQRDQITGEQLAAQLDYWRRTLAGAPLGPALPFDHVPADPTRRLRSQPVHIGRERRRALAGLASTAGASVFIVCVAAVAGLLSRLGDASDIMLSTTLSGRRRAELEGVIGTFAGTGRIRTDLSGDPSFAEAVARARGSVLGLFEHQDIPFSRVREAVLPELAASRGAGPPLALLPVDLQYFRAAPDRWQPGAGVIERPGPDRGPDELYFRGQLHPLSITLLDDGGELWGDVVYKADFYHDATVARLVSGLGQLLGSALADPWRRLSSMEIG